MNEPLTLHLVSKWPPEVLAAVLPAVLLDIANDEEALQALGILPGEIANLKGAISIRADGAGLTAEMVAVIVAFSPAINHVAKSLWDLLEERFRRRFGDDVFGEPD